MGGGDTEVGGNGSVWWKVTHLDKGGTKKWLASNGETTTARKGPLPKPGPDGVSVSDEVVGHNSTSVKEAGKRLGHPGWFVVTMRYRTMEEAKKAGPWVAENVRPGPGGWLLSVRVPVINRKTPDENRPFEIRVEW